MKTIEQEWTGFAAMIFGGAVPTEAQYDEMRKAFFAGYWSLFCALQQIGEPETNEKDAEAFLEARGAEIEAYRKSMHAEISKRPEPPLMRHMTEPELDAHLSAKIRYLKATQTPDTIGSMLIIFQDNGVCLYSATIDPETAPQALREVADRIEKRETVKR